MLLNACVLSGEKEASASFVAAEPLDIEFGHRAGPFQLQMWRTQIKNYYVVPF
jgi:hypothetical protein